MSNFPAAVPFVAVLRFLGLILKLTSDVLDWIALWTSRYFRRQNCNIKPGSHITVMVQAAVSKAEYDYGTCVLSQVPQAEFNLVPGTAGRVQSCPRYRRYRTVRQKESDESLLRWNSS